MGRTQRRKRILQPPLERAGLEIGEEAMVVEGDGVGGDVLFHAVFPRLISVATASSRVGQRRVLPRCDRRGGFMRLQARQ